MLIKINQVDEGLTTFRVKSVCPENAGADEVRHAVEIKHLLERYFQGLSGCTIVEGNAETTQAALAAAALISRRRRGEPE
jgi:hypothetical protein